MALHPPAFLHQRHDNRTGRLPDLGVVVLLEQLQPILRPPAELPLTHRPSLTDTVQLRRSSPCSVSGVKLHISSLVKFLLKSSKDILEDEAPGVAQANQLNPGVLLHAVTLEQRPAVSIAPAFSHK
ncbi:hypothetical protein EYF80_013698 [Liparis tanakae]|uniref:Uncharacterized protein n=1 Tax=Liparis tanakae TaxID=230148 RepID=A0A4Z2IE35_9TELE|nr:hypothetical protein EYF80_013698 [Liparis tanakae]